MASIDLDAVAARAYATSKRNGWGEDIPPDPSKRAQLKLAWLMLQSTEVSEVAQDVRAGRDETEEVADVVLSALCYAQWFGLDITTAIERKLAKNASRGYRHGGKLA